MRRILDAVDPLRIILFGSVGRGTSDRYSDIDVLVIVTDATHRRKSSQIIYKHLLGFGIPVDVVVATISDINRYQDSKGLIYQQALKEGRELYAA